MKRLFSITFIITMIAAAAALAGDDALGFYFSDTDFTRDSASIETSPDFAQTAYVVLTNATGSVINGYEVMITTTSPDFSIVTTGLGWGENSGTNSNQIVDFLTPVPVDPGGTVLTMCIFSQSVTEFVEISFDASEPSSLPDGVPTVTYADLGVLPCTYPFEGSVVAWLNEDPVATTGRNLSSVKDLFR